MKHINNILKCKMRDREKQAKRRGVFYSPKRNRSQLCPVFIINNNWDRRSRFGFIFVVSS